MSEPIDLEATPATPAATQALERRAENAGAITSVNAPGSALARLSEAEFQEVLATTKLARARIRIVLRELMTEGVHWQVIGETKDGEEPKRNLGQAGASVIRQAFRLVPDPQSTITYGDGKTSPPIAVVVRSLIHLDNLEGPVAAIGIGAANSWEKRWRYVEQKRKCPDCGQPTILRSKKIEDGDLGWFCWKKLGGCGAKFAGTAQAITGQQVGMMDTPDPWEFLNTIVKMASKRATTLGTIEAAGAFDLLTHDLEDSPEQMEQAMAEAQARFKRGERSPIKPAVDAQSPAVAAAAAKPAAPANGGGAPKPATDKQVDYLRRLATSKLGIDQADDDRISEQLAARWGVTTWPGLSVGEAGRLISELGKLDPWSGAAKPAATSEDRRPTGPIMPAKTPEPAVVNGDHIETQKLYIEHVAKLATDLDGILGLSIGPKYEPVLEELGEELALTAPYYLGVMELKTPRVLRSLSLDQLKYLGNLLQRDIDKSRKGSAVAS